jgi:hypothetical protein
MRSLSHRSPLPPKAPLCVLNGTVLALIRSVPRRAVGASAPRSSSLTSDLRITRVSPCVARGLKAHASFMFAGCCRWRSLAVDGGSGASRGHESVMRGPCHALWSGSHGTAPPPLDDQNGMLARTAASSRSCSERRLRSASGLMGMSRAEKRNRSPGRRSAPPLCSMTTATVRAPPASRSRRWRRAAGARRRRPMTVSSAPVRINLRIRLVRASRVSLGASYLSAGPADGLHTTRSRRCAGSLIAGICTSAPRYVSSMVRFCALQERVAPGLDARLRIHILTWAFCLARVTGIEPALSAWESDRSRPMTPLSSRLH